MTKEMSVKASSFGGFERFTAGFCMAIPLLLIIAEMETDAKKWIYLGLTLALVGFVPRLTKATLKLVERKNQGRWITIVSALMLVVFSIISVRMNFTIRGSISAYVAMEDGHIFGMLLSIASMLFIANGFVYKNDQSLEGAGFRKWLNILLGLLLLGVVVFRCDRSYYIHMFFALSFIGFCLIGTVKRRKGSSAAVKQLVATAAEKAKRRGHAFWDITPVVGMVLITFFWLAGSYNWLPWPWLKHVTFFGVESMALWIVGADFILVSLKKEKL